MGNAIVSAYAGNRYIPPPPRGSLFLQPSSTSRTKRSGMAWHPRIEPTEARRHCCT